MAGLLSFYHVTYFIGFGFPLHVDEGCFASSCKGGIEIEHVAVLLTLRNQGIEPELQVSILEGYFPGFGFCTIACNGTFHILCKGGVASYRYAAVNAQVGVLQLLACNRHRCDFRSRTMLYPVVEKRFYGHPFLRTGCRYEYKREQQCWN